MTDKEFLIQAIKNEFVVNTRHECYDLIMLLIKYEFIDAHPAIDFDAYDFIEYENVDDVTREQYGEGWKKCKAAITAADGNVLKVGAKNMPDADGFGRSGTFAILKPFKLVINGVDEGCLIWEPEYELLRTYDWHILQDLRCIIEEIH